MSVHVDQIRRRALNLKQPNYGHKTSICICNKAQHQYASLLPNFQLHLYTCSFLIMRQCNSYFILIKTNYLQLFVGLSRLDMIFPDHAERVLLSQMFQHLVVVDSRLLSPTGHVRCHQIRQENLLNGHLYTEQTCRQCI